MEKVTDWIKIGKIIGISPRKFKAIEEKSLKNYEKIQNSLSQAQEEMGKLRIVSSECLQHYSNYIMKLQSGLEKQLNFTSLHSLKLIMLTIKRRFQYECREKYLKRLYAACLWVKAVLSDMTGGSISSIIFMAIFELDLLIDFIQDKRQDIQRILADNF